MKKEKQFREITPQELQLRQEEGCPPVIIDTLPEAVFSQRKIPGAGNACVFEVTFADQVAEIVDDRGRDIVLYGSSGTSMDAITAAEKLSRLGYGNVYVLKGGIRAWQEAGFILDGEDGDVGETSQEQQLDFADGRYEVDTAASLIEWTGRNPNNKHYGRLRLSAGELKMKSNTFSGRMEIDMDSIENINLAGDELQPVLISHLKSDDFFFVSLFPKAEVIIDAGRRIDSPLLSSPNYEIEGRLKLRGASKDILFPATLYKSEQGGIQAEAHFDFDRTRWDIIYGSSRFFEHLGMHLVYDPISIQLRMIANVSGE